MRPKANMAASIDDDFEFNNQDYYSLLNVRKEVWLVFCILLKSDGNRHVSVTAERFVIEQVVCSRCIILFSPWRRLRLVDAADMHEQQCFKSALYMNVSS